MGVLFPTTNDDDDLIMLHLCRFSLSLSFSLLPASLHLLRTIHLKFGATQQFLGIQLKVLLLSFNLILSVSSSAGSFFFAINLAEEKDEVIVS